MHDPIGAPQLFADESHKSSKSAGNHFDIEFSVPLVHRLRFTNDCFGVDFPIVRNLLTSEGGGRVRAQVWLDAGLEAQGMTQRIVEAIGTAAEIELVGPPTLLPGGEQVKNDPAWIENLLAAINRDNLDRRSYVLVVGGGAVLDAVGYAAAVAHRGIRLVRFPTTTLAQADSGVGVKNAVNWFGKKNWKGTFCAPWGVVNDQGLLATLSDRDFRCGFSEAVKVALLKSPRFFDFLHDSAGLIAERNAVAAQHAIRTSVLLHLHHITRGGDPFEMEQARPLDFGHWSAHKLEAITQYGLRHGEAVSIGVAVDTAYSHLCLGFPHAAVEKTFQTLLDLQLPLWNQALHEEVLFDGLEEFRQHLGGELTVTLLEDVGQPIHVHTIDHGAVREAIAMVIEWNRNFV
jgi:3-dehydroquinate synthase